LQAAGGLHHLIANHWQILCTKNATLLTGFEEPLQTELQTYKRIERSAAYERLLMEKSKLIKQTEAESISTSRRKQRGESSNSQHRWYSYIYVDIHAFKRTLAALQAHVDDLDRLKAQHYMQILEHEAEVWNTVLDKTSLVVRSSLDIFERLSAKSSDPMLEPLMQSVLDPFDAYGPTKSENEIFSILPPLAIMSNPQTSMRGPSPSPPAFGTYSTNGAGATNGSSYSHSNTSTSLGWSGNPASDWSRQMNESPSSSTTSFGNYVERETPTRRPSSPPSTSTLRKSGIKDRPSIQTIGDTLSSSTIKIASPADSIDSIPSPRKDARRDTIIAPRPPPPQPKITETGSEDITVTLSHPSHDSFERKQSIAAGKKAGFSLSRFMGSSGGVNDT
ncbi:hypothetical protein FRC17_006924, partial [Serendipita sp. 399]